MEASKYRSVLLVDDSYIDNLINRKIIEKNHFADEIIVISSPVDAISYLKECLATNTNIPDVIFLDIRMPEMTGFEFLQELKTIEGSDQKFKIFILSSSLDPLDIEESRKSNWVSKFISKPLTAEVLFGLG